MCNEINTNKMKKNIESISNKREYKSHSNKRIASILGLLDTYNNI